MRRAAFIDKDGTLVENVPYNVDPDRIRLAPRAGEALRLLAREGFRLIVVSNQSGVARGMFGEDALDRVADRIRELLAAEGVSVGGFYWCTHAPSDVGEACECRKPAPGMLLRAAADHGFDLAASWMLGDILHDVEAGHRAGARSVLIDNGGETEWVLSPLRMPEYVCGDLAEAAGFVVAQASGASREGRLWTVHSRG